MAQKDITDQPLITNAKMSKTPRTTESFRDSIEIYIVGVPINYKFERHERIVEFKNLLMRAKKDLWPVFASSPSHYFQYLAPDGWKTVTDIGVGVKRLTFDSKTRREWTNGIISQVVRLAQFITVPILLLRAGSPKTSDAVVAEIIRIFNAQQKT